MSTKTALLTGVTGVIEYADAQFVVNSFSEPVGLVAEFTNPNDKILVVHDNMAGTGVQPVTDASGKVYLHSGKRGIILDMPDTYGVTGKIAGTLNLYKIED